MKVSTEGPDNKSSALQFGTYRIVLLYVTISLIWIFTSDFLVMSNSNDQESSFLLSATKGSGFVLATAILLFYLISKEVRKARELRDKEEQVHRQKGLYATLAGNFPNGAVMLFDTEMRFIDSAGAWSAEMTRGEQEIIGLKVGDVFSQEISGMLTSSLQKSFQGMRESHEIEISGEFFILNTVPVRDDAGTVYASLAVVQKVTGIKRSELQLELRVKQLAALVEISKSLLGDDDPVEMLDRSCMFIARFLDVQIVWVGVRDESTGAMGPYACWGAPIETVSKCFSGMDEATIVMQPEWTPLKDGRTVRAGKTDPSDGAAPSMVISCDPSLHSMISIPLVSARSFLGVLNLYSSRDDKFDDDLVMSMTPMINILSMGLQNINYIERIERHRQDLEAIVDDRTKDLVELNEELESFAHSVSHDLKAPLRAIHGLSVAIIEDHGETLDEGSKDYLRRISNSAQEMDALITDLLDYAHISRVELMDSKVDLHEVVDEVLMQMAHELNERKAMVFAEVPPILIKGQRQILLQIVTNLLSNAIKFVRAGTKPEVRIIVEDNGHIIRLWVEDNGVGIKMEDQARLFKMFERLHTREEFPGTGIGLAIVAKGVERMGGRYGVVSHLESGSRFWVEFEKA